MSWLANMLKGIVAGVVEGVEAPLLAWLQRRALLREGGAQQVAKEDAATVVEMENVAKADAVDLAGGTADLRSKLLDSSRPG